MLFQLKAKAPRGIYNNLIPLDARTILWYPTTHSKCNPIYTTLKDLNEKDRHTSFNNHKFLKVPEEIEETKKKLKNISIIKVLE